MSVSVMTHKRHNIQWVEKIYQIFKNKRTKQTHQDILMFSVLFMCYNCDPLNDLFLCITWHWQNTKTILLIWVLMLAFHLTRKWVTDCDNFFLFQFSSKQFIRLGSESLHNNSYVWVQKPLEIGSEQKYWII